MLTRREWLVGTSAVAIGGTTAANAQAWKAKYPELVLAVIPAENASGVADRFGPFIDYLTKEIGTKVTLRIANDYAAVIEGQRSGNVHIGHYGPASFSRALLTGVPTEAFAIEVNHDGSKGYYSVFYVKASSPYHKIQDLKGKNLGLVDPNSTSGNNMPRFILDKEGIDPEKFFGKVVFTGSHENGVIAVAQGTVDVAADWWNNENDSNLTRMLDKGMLKNANGTPMKKDDFRIILKSPLIINSPVAYLTSLPDDLKARIKEAYFQADKKAPAAYAKLSDGKDQAYQPITNADYASTIKLIKFVDDLRKKRA